MSVFAVTYTYSASEPELAEIRPTHREFLKNLLVQGVLLASGPMVDRPGALLIVRADSVEEVADRAEFHLHRVFDQIANEFFQEQQVNA